MKLEDLIAREEIRELIYSYCRAIDARDWETVMACFSPDAIISHGSYTGPADTFLSFAKDFINQMSSTIHTPGGIIVEFDGELAKTNTPFASFHHIAGHVGKVGPVDTGGVDTDWIVSGRYCDTLKKIDGRWKIIKRQAYNDWTRAEPSRPAKS